MGGIFSNTIEQNALYFEIDDTIVKEGDTNILEIGLGNINQQKGINGCGNTGMVEIGMQGSRYSGGYQKMNLPDILVEGECGNVYNREDYFSTCFMTPKNINVRGVDNADNCRIIYKAELNCGENEEVVEPFENKKEDDNFNLIILLIILLVVICFLKK